MCMVAPDWIPQASRVRSSLSLRPQCTSSNIKTQPAHEIRKSLTSLPVNNTRVWLTYQIWVRDGVWELRGHQLFQCGDSVSSRRNITRHHLREGEGGLGLVHELQRQLPVRGRHLYLVDQGRNYKHSKRGARSRVCLSKRFTLDFRRGIREEIRAEDNEDVNIASLTVEGTLCEQTCSSRIKCWLAEQFPLFYWT